VISFRSLCSGSSLTTVWHRHGRLLNCPYCCGAMVSAMRGVLLQWYARWLSLTVAVPTAAQLCWTCHV